LQFVSNLPVNVNLDDLIGEGIMGLLDATQKYDQGKKVPFGFYAKYRIQGAILDSLRQLDWASRDMRRQRKQIDNAVEKLTVKLQENPSEAEVAEELGISLKELHQKILHVPTSPIMSASTYGGAPEDSDAPDYPSSSSEQPDAIFANEQLRSKLAEAMKTLAPRYQTVLTHYYHDEMTMREIGNILGTNESRVSQLHKVALVKLYEALRNLGVTSFKDFDLEPHKITKFSQPRKI